MTEMYLVLIETSGNQNYIFSTNKLKENIGASELTYRAGTQWVLEAVADINNEKNPEEDAARVRALLRDHKINPPIESLAKPIEVITAASGKALLLTRDEETAQKVIRFVTRKALIEAPGLDVSGVYDEIEDWDKTNSLAEAIRTVHKKFENARSHRPSPASRFLRLPIVADCAVSELPASRLEPITKAQAKDGKKVKPISEVSFVKRKISSKAKDRLTALDQRLSSQIDQILQENNEIESRSWLAIVHADGNGLGQIFLQFHHYIGEDKSNRNYIKKYREFSLSLDQCTEAAFKKALNVFPREDTHKAVAPIVPLIIGGDDLTVVCDGKYALEFTREFLQEFEKQTEKHKGITEIAQEAFGVGRLSACAGVAIVKRHFPFSVAYELAASLIKSAKEVKQKITKKGSDRKVPFPCSAIDFHILYDTSGGDLNVIRQKLESQNEKLTRLYNRPYVVTMPDEQLIETQSENNEDIGFDWIKPRKWEVLQKWVDLVKNVELLPSSQSHTLRTALYSGATIAEAQYQLIQSRYPVLKDFLKREHQSSLFHAENLRKNRTVVTCQITPFLDALDAMEFLKNELTTTKQEEKAK